MSVVMLLAAWGWWAAALSHAWPLWLSQAPVPIAEGLGALVRLAVAAMWTLLSAVMASATAAVVPRRGGRPEPARIPGRSTTSTLAARVATALLVLTCTGPYPSFAAAAPVSTSPMTQDADAAATATHPHRVGDPGPHPRDPGHRDPEGRTAERSATQIPVPGWLPAARSHPPDVALLARGVEEDHLVTVRAGDTLWSIAAEQLTGSPTVEQVAADWPRWYAANRELIGPDPDLILPGQQLRPPSPSPEGALP